MVFFPLTLSLGFKGNLLFVILRPCAQELPLFIIHFFGQHQFTFDMLENCRRCREINQWEGFVFVFFICEQPHKVIPSLYVERKMQNTFGSHFCCSFPFLRQLIKLLPFGTSYKKLKIIKTFPFASCPLWVKTQFQWRLLFPPCFTSFSMSLRKISVDCGACLFSFWLQCTLTFWGLSILRTVLECFRFHNSPYIF